MANILCEIQGKPIDDSIYRQNKRNIKINIVSEDMNFISLLSSKKNFSCKFIIKRIMIMSE